MKYQIYSVRDEAAQSFGVPFFCPTESVGIRSFSMLVKDPQSTVFACPSDYTLYYLGEIDLATGIFSSITPVLILRADSFTQGA